MTSKHTSDSKTGPARSREGPIVQIVAFQAAAVQGVREAPVAPTVPHAPLRPAGTLQERLLPLLPQDLMESEVGTAQILQEIGVLVGRVALKGRGLRVPQDLEHFGPVVCFGQPVESFQVLGLCTRQ